MKREKRSTIRLPADVCILFQSDPGHRAWGGGGSNLSLLMLFSHLQKIDVGVRPSVYEFPPLTVGVLRPVGKRTKTIQNLRVA